MQRTFVMVKPDGVYRRLIGKVIQRFEDKGFKIIAMDFKNMSKKQAEELYSVHKGKDFYDKLINYITAGPVVTMALEGKSVIDSVRKVIGATNPAEALAGTIRGDYASEIRRNIVHASDSKESAERELKVIFGDRFVDYTELDEEWLYEGD